MSQRQSRSILTAFAVRVLVPAVLVSVVLTSTMACAADAPPVKLALQFQPSQRDVEFDIPDPKTYDKCKVTAVRDGKLTGWLVHGAQGELLRRFMDTNGDGEVDQFSYFRGGMEVFRDHDSNGNNKIDQSRWLNIGGSKWGIDINEDGRIDAWKRISAEEASQIAIKALVIQDPALISTVLINKDDLKTLGIKGDLEAKILAAVSDLPARIKKAGSSKFITAQTRFLKFDGVNPGVVLAEEWKTPTDITIYEYANAMIDPGNNKPVLVQIGEMIRVGDTWKLTGIPQVMEGSEEQLAYGPLLSPNMDGSPATAADATGDNLGEEERKLVEEIQALDKAPPGLEASRREQARYNLRRADLLASLKKLAKSETLREQWLRQEVDGVTAAAQLEPAPESVSRLKQVEIDVRKQPKSTLIAYVVYRRMLAEHALEMQRAETNEDRTKVDEKWLKYVEEFVEEFPSVDESAEAALQLAIAAEFSDKAADARKWYGKIVKEFAGTPAVEKATGALRRMDLDGKTLVLAGPGLQGGTIDIKQIRARVTLVVFWATWSKPCQEDLPELKKLYTEFHGRGLEILGVNLDERKQEVLGYLGQSGATWPQIHVPGGLESEPAKAYGVISLPTMFLVDGNGKVINRSINVANLKTYLGENLKK